MEGGGCYACGAPMVIDYGIGAGAGVGAGAGKVGQYIHTYIYKTLLMCLGISSRWG